MGDKGVQSTLSSDFDILKTVSPKAMALLVQSQYHSIHLMKFAVFLNLLKT